MVDKDPKTADAPKDTHKNESSTPDKAADAPKSVPSGSPVTAGTKSGSDDPGKGGVTATEGNKSTTTVAPKEETPNTVPESPTPSEEELDAIDRADWQQSEQANSLRKVRKLVSLLSASPDSHIVYGYGGTTITLGDLRRVVDNVDLGDDD